jgi:protein-disulfide isomerase
MAGKTAEAARCVRDQRGDSGYFLYHDKVFNEQMKLDGGTVKSTVSYTDADLKKWATELGDINAATFASCLDSGKYASAVQADLAYGQQLGISGTPGFFVNGRILEGAQPFAAFKQLIDAELA